MSSHGISIAECSHTSGDFAGQSLLHCVHTDRTVKALHLPKGCVGRFSVSICSFTRYFLQCVVLHVDTSRLQPLWGRHKAAAGASEHMKGPCAASAAISSSQ